MNKLFSKVAALSVGLAMAIGVGVAVGSKAPVRAKADTTSSVTLSSGTYVTDHIEWNLDGAITVSQTKGSSGTAVNPSYISAPRVYKGHVLSFVASGNYLIKSIEITVNGTNYGNSMTAGTVISSDGKTVTDNPTEIARTWTSTSGGKHVISSSDGVEAIYIQNVASATNVQLRFTALSITYSTSSVSDPVITVSPSSLEFLTGGESKSVTVTPANFSGTPTLSLESEPNHVTYSVSGLSISFSPKSIGNDDVTIKATYGTEVATKSVSISVEDSHGRIPSDPYSVAEIVELIGTSTETFSNRYVAGYISKIDEYKSDYHSITYWISDDGSTTSQQFEAYSGLGLNSAPFNSIEDIAVGASVVICGDAKLYKGTYEFNFNNYLVSYDEPSLVLDHISLDTTSVKLSFEQGETFTSEGLIVTAHYENGSSKAVTPTSISSPDMSSVGEKTVTVSYTEAEVEKTADYNINVVAPSVKHTISFLPGEGSGTMESVQVKDGDSYELPECTFTAPEGKVFDNWDVGAVIESVTSDVVATALWKDKPAEAVDVLTANLIGLTSYADWDSLAGSESDAVYAGNSTKSSGGAIQMRSNNSNSGIVSTSSGGTIVSIEVAWGSEVTQARTLEIWGSHNAYTQATQLYGSSAVGTKVGSLEWPGSATSQKYTFEEEYEYFGVRSNSGALYLDSISITWSTSVTPKVLESISLNTDNVKNTFEQGEEFTSEGLVVTAHYDNGSSKSVTPTNISSPDMNTIGEKDVTISYTEAAVTKEASYKITVIAPIVKHTISFNPGEGSGEMESVQVNDGDSYELPACTFTAPEGKTFDHWDASASIDPVTSDVVLTAIYREIQLATYVKVTGALNDYSGKYLIVYEGDDNHDAAAFDGAKDPLDAAFNSFTVTVSDGVIQAEEGHEFTVAALEADGKYSIQSASGYYIGRETGSSGGAMNTSTTNAYQNEISVVSGESVVTTITSKSGSTLRFNYAKDQLRFRYFASGQQAVTLYRLATAESFAELLVNDTAANCSAYGGTKAGEVTPEMVAAYNVTWSTLMAQYNGLADEEKAILLAADPKEGTTVETAMARYYHIVGKYGVENFMGLDVPSLTRNYMDLTTVENNNTLIIIIAIATTTAVAFTTLLLIKKRKHN